MRRRIACGLLGAALAVPSAFAAAPMTAAELRAKVVGRQLCTTRAGGFLGRPICFTYRADGVVLAEVDPGQQPRWEMEGDRLCLFDGANPKDRRCSTFERVDARRLRMDGDGIVCIGACAE